MDVDKGMIEFGDPGGVEGGLCALDSSIAASESEVVSECETSHQWSLHSGASETSPPLVASRRSSSSDEVPLIDRSVPAVPPSAAVPTHSSSGVATPNGYFPPLCPLMSSSLLGGAACSRLGKGKGKGK
ncbi:unnamed protein product, partial [Choristocarpus tenellus]